MGEEIIDGNPIELDDSSEALAENGLLGIKGFIRPRVFDNIDDGDGLNGASSEVLLIGLDRCGLPLACDSSGPPDVELAGSMAEFFKAPRGRDKGEAS